MNTVFKNLSQFFTPGDSPTNHEPRLERGIDQSHHVSGTSPNNGSRDLSNTISRGYPERKSSPTKIGRFLTRVQSWFESSDEDDNLLAYSDEDAMEVRGRGTDVREWDDRTGSGYKNGIEDGSGAYEDRRWEEGSLSKRTKSFSEPPRGRKRSRDF